MLKSADWMYHTETSVNAEMLKEEYVLGKIDSTFISLLGPFPYKHAGLA